MSDGKLCMYDQAPDTLDRSRYEGCTRKRGHRGACAHPYSESVMREHSEHFDRFYGLPRPAASPSVSTPVKCDVCGERDATHGGSDSPPFCDECGGVGRWRSPVSTPVKITEKHVTVMETGLSEARRAVMQHESIARREVLSGHRDTAAKHTAYASEYQSIVLHLEENQSLLRSLSDGSRDTFDTREEVRVPRDEALKVYGAMQACGLHGNFLHIIDRWLTPDGEKR